MEESIKLQQKATTEEQVEEKKEEQKEKELKEKEKAEDGVTRFISAEEQTDQLPPNSNEETAAPLSINIPIPPPPPPPKKSPTPFPESNLVLRKKGEDSNPNSSLVCTICYAESDQVYEHKICHNFFCKLCFNSHYRSHLGRTTSYKIVCIYCSMPFNEDQIKELLDEDLWKRVERLRRLELVRTDKNGVYCPKCGFGQIRDQPELLHHACIDCGFDFCVSCMLEHHVPLTCNQKKAEKRAEEDAKLTLVEKSKKTLVQTRNVFGGMVSQARISLQTKKCPTCAHPIEKNGGCSHMHCTNCNTDFCWRCLKPYSGSHCILENILLFGGIPLLLPLGLGPASGLLLSYMFVSGKI